MELNILQDLQYEFSKQRLVNEVSEDAKAEKMNNITELIRQQIYASTLPPEPPVRIPQVQRIPNSKLSMSEFTYVKEDLAKIKWKRT